MYIQTLGVGMFDSSRPQDGDLLRRVQPLLLIHRHNGLQSMSPIHYVSDDVHGQEPQHHG